MKLLKITKLGASAMAVIFAMTLGTTLNAQGKSKKNKDKTEKVKKDKGEKEKVDKETKNFEKLEERRNDINKESKALDNQRKEEMRLLKEEMKNASPQEKKQMAERMKEVKEAYKTERKDIRDKKARVLESEIEVLETRRDKLDDNNGKGNAYGRNKNGLSGREFGQQRAFEAKNKIEVERQIIERRRGLIEIASERAENARLRLEEDQRENRIKDDEVKRRRAAIDNVTKKVDILRANINAKEKLINQQEKNLKAFEKTED